MKFLCTNLDRDKGSIKLSRKQQTWLAAVLWVGIEESLGSRQEL